MADDSSQEIQRVINENLQSYAKSKVERVLKEMLHELFLATPEDPVQFMIDFLIDYKDKSHDVTSETSTAREEAGPPPDHLSALPVFDVGPTQQYNRGRRRVAVSAEPVDALDDAEVPDVVVPKSEEDMDRIKQAVSANILFNSLDDDEMNVVLNAMEPKTYQAGDVIIKQGDVGDSFYVLDEGECECFVSFNGAPPKLVKTYTHGESFGELALMYNCPRAATIAAKTPVKAWAMGRVTFRKVLMNATSEKRKQYEEFLTRVPLLETLDKYERSKVADALKEERFRDGECIIAQGDRGNSMYIVKEGGAEATKILPGSDEPQVVMRYGPGDFFGELALLSDKPRAANVHAVGETVCVSLDRASFIRLLGPCEIIMKRKVDTYRHEETKVMSRRRGAVSAEPVTGLENSNWQRVVIPKTPEQESDIRKAVSNNFLFTSLDPEQMQIVVDAMFIKQFAAGDKIISQGDDGDLFYVLDRGECDCYVRKGNNPPIVVKHYRHGESFGELALMYNTKRAATIQAVTPVTVWCMDRITFHRVLMQTTDEKRKKYEGFLSQVPLLSSLDHYERASLADALEPVTFEAGDYIIRKGETGDAFYIVEQGEAVATKALHAGEAEQEVYRYRAGDYFGELALLHDQPRAANIIAVGPVTALRLDRGAFTRLLGPCEEILKRNRDNYEAIEERLRQQSLSRSGSAVQVPVPMEE